MPEHHQKTALIRFLAVSAVLAKLEAGISFSSVLREVTKSPPQATDGRKIRFSERTLRRWVADYKRDGFDGLLPVDRRIGTASRVLKNDFISYICQEKAMDKEASIPQLMLRAKEDKIDIGSSSRVTVWRAAKRLNLPIFAAKAPENTNMRRFSYKYSMQMVMTDGVHFRAGPTRAKRVAMILLDDATRFALAGVVGYSETTELFMRLIWAGFNRHGLFSNIFVDNGSGFASGDATLIFARMDIPLIHGTVDYPEGRGKIERFNRTIRADLLRGFDGFGDASIEHLQLQLNHHLEHVYNMSPHSALDDETPMQRFLDLRLKSVKPLDYKKLRDHFIVSIKRKVSRTNDVKMGNKVLEVPKGYAGRTVIIIKDILIQQYFIDHEQKRIQLFLADYTHNAVTGRERMKIEARKENEFGPVDTASNKNFRKTYRPIVSPSGDFYEKEDL